MDVAVHRHSDSSSWTENHVRLWMRGNVNAIALAIGFASRCAYVRRLDVDGINR